MRISDWSSDVCSSDLLGVVARDGAGTKRIRARLGVVLATGGYDWKSEYVRAFDALPEAGSMAPPTRSEEHTSELQSLMRISYAAFCLKTNSYPRIRLHRLRTEHHAATRTSQSLSTHEQRPRTP